MTARRDLERRLYSLGEIREVMNSMKTLAYMETRKLARFLAIQQQQVSDIERMTADLLAHYPTLHAALVQPASGAIVIGAERGFCGDFNERLLREEPAPEIAVGRRLGARLDLTARDVTVLEGASATEQVASVRDALAAAVADRPRAQGLPALVFHDKADAPPRRRGLIPSPVQISKLAQQSGHPPRLHLPPASVFAALLDQYLFAILSEALYSSLMAENQKRQQHLESAVQHLDDRREELQRRSHALRQEEIIEEIEVILLNVADPAKAHTGTTA